MNSRNNQKINSVFTLTGAVVTAAYLYFMGSFNYNVIAPLFIILVAALVARYFTRKALEHNLHPVVWLLLAPLFFAIAAFGIWSSCVIGAQILNNAVKAAPSVDFIELVTGIFTRGIAYAQMGLLIGIAWALPSSLAIAALKATHHIETKNPVGVYQFKNETLS
ncbi:hypothetical protein [Candidatus Chlorohelix sp.]|uniref:hypothetical protein n=1 Tax=Candidatus Chlorohelix sp. TaxID=3139201 RepID=UPI003068C08A